MFQENNRSINLVVSEKKMFESEKEFVQETMFEKFAREREDMCSRKKFEKFVRE